MRTLVLAISDVDAARRVPRNHEFSGRAAVAALAAEHRPRRPRGRETLKARPGSIVAISPLVGGRAISGPLVSLLRQFHYENTSMGISRFYSPFLTAFVLDRRDRRQADELDSWAIQPIVTDIVFATPAKAAEVARVMLHVLDVR